MRSNARPDGLILSSPVPGISQVRGRGQRPDSYDSRQASSEDSTRGQWRSMGPSFLGRGDAVADGRAPVHDLGRRGRRRLQRSDCCPSTEFAELTLPASSRSVRRLPTVTDCRAPAIGGEAVARRACRRMPGDARRRRSGCRLRPTQSSLERTSAMWSAASADR